MFVLFWQSCPGICSLGTAAGTTVIKLDTSSWFSIPIAWSSQRPDHHPCICRRNCRCYQSYFVTVVHTRPLLCITGVPPSNLPSGEVLTVPTLPPRGSHLPLLVPAGMGASWAVPGAWVAISHAAPFVSEGQVRADQTWLMLSIDTVVIWCCSLCISYWELGQLPSIEVEVHT